MSFDRPARDALAKMVDQARERLKADAMDQLRRLGFQADGTVLELEQVAGLTEAERDAADELRALLAHFVAAESGAGAARRQTAYDRLAREIGFTTLNRLVALRMAEERGLIVQAVDGGLGSDGFQLYERVANGALGSRAETYRAYLECLYDELAVDLPLLFDRATPKSRVFPGERCLEDVLGLLNDPALAPLWKKDETIGWMYQYYNDPAERKKMREASQAPRNSRELAVRNQYFTPRYAVEFLTDNTLGRTWYEMRQGDTRLADECRYLVRRPAEIFLRRGEEPPADGPPTDGLSPEELLRQPVYVPYRAKKDPRKIKVLDPACGSGHFLLYAFDLLATIYDEAYDDPALGRVLQRDYSDRDRYRRAVPGLILRHNLHGIDIDPRACQIAALALWLRGQRAYQSLGLRGADRPRISKSNIVTAEPMPGEREMLDEFVARLAPPLVGGLVKFVFQRMRLAGELGPLLKIEEDLREAVARARRQWERRPRAEQLALLPGFERRRAEQMEPFDLSGISHDVLWAGIEGRVFAALAAYTAEATNGHSTQRRLFADDTLRGFAFADLVSGRYDVVLMNPPFGEPSRGSKPYIERAYPRTKNHVYATFVERGLSTLRESGLLGAVTSRTGFLLIGSPGVDRGMARSGPAARAAIRGVRRVLFRARLEQKLLQ
jgi:hypothetical protein